MISSISNLSFTTPLNNIQKSNPKPFKSYLASNSQTDKVILSFKGKSLPSEYHSIFDYMASVILDSNHKKFHIDGSVISAKKIGAAIKKIVEDDEMWNSFKKSDAKKIKWKSYVPQDIREYSIDKINQAREVRLKDWENFLKNPEELNPKTGEQFNPELVSKIKGNDSLKFVIWNSVTGELKENNRHIPVPFDEKALLLAIKRFERPAPLDWATFINPTFLESYTHRLRDNLLMDMGKSNNKAVWVKIPSIKHDPKNKDKNISALETLSCRNWCTRSSVDKAEDALTDGDFYIYLERKGKSNLWDPVVGMTTNNGKIDQIQGVENNNIVPLTLVSKIREFIETNNLKCQSGIIDEGPKASQAIMISEKLNETSSVFKKSFAKAIKDEDNFAIFRFLNVDTKYTPDGKLEISGYKPSYNMNVNSGVSIPYSMFGFNEDDLLKDVKIIRGNFILDNKNPLYNSRITQFPQNLEQVTGRIVCNANQFEKFADDIRRVTGGDMSKVIIHGK